MSYDSYTKCNGCYKLELQLRRLEYMYLNDIKDVDKYEKSLEEEIDNLKELAQNLMKSLSHYTLYEEERLDLIEEAFAYLGRSSILETERYGIKASLLVKGIKYKIDFLTKKLSYSHVLFKAKGLIIDLLNELNTMDFESQDEVIELRKWKQMYIDS